MRHRRTVQRRCLRNGRHVRTLASMATTKMLRVSERTHAGFKREAERRGETIDSVASAALRALRQKEMGRQLTEPLRDDEQAWLDADLG